VKQLEPNQNPLREDLDHILAHTRPSWEIMRGQDIFVTGATGFFGRWLLESFAHANAALKLNANLVALSRNPEAFRTRAPYLAAEPAIRFVRGDVGTLTAEAVHGQLGPGSPQIYQFVIHAATEASAKLNAEDPLLMTRTIVEGTRAALQFAVSVGARRFLLTSSGAVYGPQPPDLTHIPEDYTGAPDCTHPGAAYGEGKRMAELLCVCYHKQYGIEPLIARPFAFVGPFLPLNAHFAIGNFVRDTLRGGPIQIKGDGTAFRSYLYAADLAIWLWTMLVKGAPCRPYNVGSPHDLSIAEIAQAVRETLNKNIAIQKEKESAANVIPSRYVPSVDRARTELGLVQHISMAEGIRRFAQHASDPRTLST
jgi:dTDP-glucose 4,6-dehydratase